VVTRTTDFGAHFCKRISEFFKLVCLLKKNKLWKKQPLFGPICTNLGKTHTQIFPAAHIFRRSLLSSATSWQYYKGSTSTLVQYTDITDQCVLCYSSNRHFPVVHLCTKTFQTPGRPLPENCKIL
jgi:hypothetical protein